MKPTHSHTIALALTISVLLFQPEPGLCQGSVDVAVITRANLRWLVRGEIDSALADFTCNNVLGAPTAENLTNTLINRLDAITDKLDTIQNRLNLLHQLGSSPVHPASSCAEMLQDFPDTPSGYYWVSNATGHTHSVYCDMTRSCGGVTGGWMRVAYLDMTNSSHQCPSSLYQRTDSGVRTCAVWSDSPSCSSVYYPSHGIHYSKVCGKINGYFENTLDGFEYHGRSTSPTIDSNYVDGVSLTYGNPNRHHIWTFAANVDCPCGNPPPFVGNNYFCDGYYTGTINLANPLWDGQGCTRSCCTFNNPPWFYRQLSQTNEDVEMRLCRDQERPDEDISVGAVEIYVQ